MRVWLTLHPEKYAEHATILKWWETTPPARRETLIYDAILAVAEPVEELADIAPPDVAPAAPPRRIPVVEEYTPEPDAGDRFTETPLIPL